MDKPLIVFVPGIMGSVLRFKGVGEFGDWCEEDVWGSDAGVIIDTLARRPNRLRSPNLEATAVLREITGRVWGKRVHEVFYGPLLDFCVERLEMGGLGLEPGNEFVPFAYDWRLDNRENAKRLAVKIKQHDPQENRPIGLVAHSMGGLVCRLMILNESAIALRIRFFLQIASPVLGAAKPSIASARGRLLVQRQTSWSE
jgi:phospholipase A1